MASTAIFSGIKGRVSSMRDIVSPTRHGRILSRPSTFLFESLKTWMPGTRPGMTTSKLRPVRGEGIAGGNFALGEAGHEPLLALLGRAVGEGIGHHAAFRALLQGIVAD